jgi:predicted flavoprotein YhiN
VEEALLDRAATQPDASLRRWLAGWLPERVASARFDEWNIPANLRLNRMSRQVRKAVVRDLEGFFLGEAGTVPLELGEVCAGGLDLQWVDPHRMAVRGWEGLRVCGELLDVNGPVGGYNLQAAFSTGFVAGNSL